MRRALPLSLGLHALLALLLVAGTWLWPPAEIKGPPVLAEVELVEQNTPTVGTPTAPAIGLPAKPNAPAQAKNSKQAHSTRPKLPRSSAVRTASPVRPKPQALPLPLPPPPPRPHVAQQTQPANSAPEARPALPAPQMTALRLGPPDSSGTGLVSGSQVIPAALDKGVKNIPPAYPPLAVRRGEQGSVILKVHVGADGSATEVDVFSTSGHPILDHAARQAVARWHFVPARQGRVPVPSTMLVKIRFVLTNPEGKQ